MNAGALYSVAQTTMSKQYLQTLTIPDAHPTDIFSLAVTPSHLLTASGASSIKIYSTRGQTIHTESAEDENPYPLVQTLEKVHHLGCHHISTSLDGKIAASVGYVSDGQQTSSSGLDHGGLREIAAARRAPHTP